MASPLLTRTLTIGCSVLLACWLPHCTLAVSTSDLGFGPRPGPEGGAGPESGIPDASPECDADLQTNASHCGACGTVCAAKTGALCTAGKCTIPKSCAQLAALSPPPASGVYRLDPNGDAAGGEFDAYCELDALADGGGWTLLMKVNGASKLFTYDSPLWTNADSYNGELPDLDSREAKLAGFATMPLVQLRVGMSDGKLRWLVLDLVGDSLQSIFQRPSLQTSLGRAAWRSLLAGPSTQLHCNREGVNVWSDHQDDKLRLGMLFNNELDCASIDSYIGVGINQLSITTAGNYAADDSDNGARDTEVFAYLMIR